VLLRKIISGGQTGVDRAALDVALETGIPAGGYCPKGRRAEDGPIDLKYPLEELNSSSYIERTRENVATADGTLVLCCGKPSGGTALTIRFTEELDKPSICVDPEDQNALELVRSWIEENQIQTLNVAGPRASKDPNIYRLSYNLLGELLN